MQYEYYLEKAQKASYFSVNFFEIIGKNNVCSYLHVQYMCLCVEEMGEEEIDASSVVQVSSSAFCCLA